eukprot:105520_1
MSTAEPTSGDSRDDRKIDFSILLKTKKNNPKFLREILQSNLEDYVIAKSPTRPQPGTVLVYRQGSTDFKADAYNMWSLGSGYINYDIGYRYFGLIVDGKPDKAFQRQVESW